MRRLITLAINLLDKPAPPPAGGFIDDLPEAFGARDESGEVFIIGYLGEWYRPIKPTPLARVRNWLVSVENRRLERECAIDELCEALRLTVEHVGPLPAQPGWSWFDALSRHAPDTLIKMGYHPTVKVG